MDKSSEIFDKALLWISAGEKVTVFEEKLIQWQGKKDVKLLASGNVTWSGK
ncbi:hypothetical protein PQO01_06925 [Lentisphaera marina]|uniref:Uncharacterized protein n=1 Tax=Lentisphaera profundi TaxID=1658616 RepID=A0ABY7VML6_9BACT|nr:MULTISPECIES: hypothetical protein [Lentisphaera]MDD7984680.1 hypothetical protein [Lentisphaera marina]WDE95255.1 hypothetical protein PQO03_05915 [Lentisphaera profundi]